MVYYFSSPYCPLFEGNDLEWNNEWLSEFLLVVVISYTLFSTTFKSYCWN